MKSSSLKRKFTCRVSIVIIAIRCTVDSIFSASCLNAWWCRWCSSHHQWRRCRSKSQHHKPRLLNGTPARGCFFFSFKVIRKSRSLHAGIVMRKRRFKRITHHRNTFPSYYYNRAHWIKSSLSMYTLFSIIFRHSLKNRSVKMCRGSETIPLLILRLRNICWCENIPRANSDSNLILHLVSTSSFIMSPAFFKKD